MLRSTIVASERGVLSARHAVPNTVPLPLRAGVCVEDADAEGDDDPAGGCCAPAGASAAVSTTAAIEAARELCMRLSLLAGRVPPG
jgi:hypothetical protein